MQLSGLKFLILRPHNIYGPRMGFSHVIPELIKKAKEKKVLEVYSPNHTRSFCYIDDAIEQIFRISNSNYKNEIFNIGNDNEEIKIISLAKKILCHLQLNKKIVQKNITKGSPSRRIPDIKKISKIIKIKNFISLDNGIRKILEWDRNE